MNYLGACLAPFSAYLVIIGLETISERLSKAVSNAEKVVEFLETRPEVAWVKHPHAKGNKYAELAKKYFPKGAGAILSFGLKGDAETIRLSLGLEDPQDLIQDLVQAFEASAK